MSTAMNERALRFWRQTGYTVDDLNAVAQEIDQKFMLARLDFQPDRPLGVTISHQTHNRKEGHFPTVIKFFEEIHSEWKGAEPLQGSILVFLEDGMWHYQMQYPRRAPLFSFSRYRGDHCSLLMADPLFLDTNAYEEDKKRIDSFEAQYTWESKKPIIFWRGSSSGLGIETHLWKDAPRVKLGIACKKVDDLSVMDTYMSRVIPMDPPELAQRIHDLGIVREHVPQEQFYQYRYQVDIDGMSNAWASCFLKLYSKSVVLKVESDYEQWYYGDIKPWEHYIPLDKDFMDIKETIGWLKAHDAQAKVMVPKANAIMASLSYERAKEETAQTLSEVLRCQKESNS